MNKSISLIEYAVKIKPEKMAISKWLDEKKEWKCTKFMFLRMLCIF